jgi:uncharacterized protein (DUF1330 family)
MKIAITLPIITIFSTTASYAQLKPPAYLYAEITVTDGYGYTRDFLPRSQANMKEHGGKYLAGTFNDAISLKGYPPPNRVVILEFPDMDALKEFYRTQSKFEDEVGSKYASFRVIAIEGVEQKK